MSLCLGSILCNLGMLGAFTASVQVAPGTHPVGDKIALCLRTSGLNYHFFSKSLRRGIIRIFSSVFHHKLNLLAYKKILLLWRSTGIIQIGILYRKKKKRNVVTFNRLLKHKCVCMQSDFLTWKTLTSKVSFTII